MSMLCPSELFEILHDSSRKVIQLTSDNKHIYALCNDGTMWKFIGQATGWEQLKPIPKD